MKTRHILIFVGYACFGIGMILGSALAGSIWWILTTIVAAFACMAIVIPTWKPRKKKLPRRKVRIIR